MDRRTVLVGSAATLLGAVGVGRVLTRGPADDVTSPPTALPPRASSPPGAPEPAVAPTTRPEPGPSRETSVAAEPPTPAERPLLCRHAWGAAPVGAGLQEHQLRRMTVHHTAVVLADNRQAPGRLRQHQRFHQAQGWPDIAYHLAADRDGHLYELRPTDAPGDTFTDYDPSGHLLVLAEGNFDQQDPTPDQLEGLAVLLAWGHTRFGLPLETISGHRDHASTSCPGEALYARLGGLRARTGELVAAGGVELVPRCGDDGTATVAAIERGEG